MYLYLYFKFMYLRFAYNESKWINLVYYPGESCILEIMRPAWVIGKTWDEQFDQNLVIVPKKISL